MDVLFKNGENCRMEKVSFILNEKLVCAEYEKGMTLLKYLRNIECMKGTKEARYGTLRRMQRFN